jgi:hypothetical protein
MHDRYSIYWLPLVDIREQSMALLQRVCPWGPATLSYREKSQTEIKFPQPPPPSSMKLLWYLRTLTLTRPNVSINEYIPVPFRIAKEEMYEKSLTSSPEDWGKKVNHPKLVWLSES